MIIQWEQNILCRLLSQQWRFRSRLVVTTAYLIRARSIATPTMLCGGIWLCQRFIWMLSMPILRQKTWRVLVIQIIQKKCTKSTFMVLRRWPQVFLTVTPIVLVGIRPIMMLGAQFMAILRVWTLCWRKLIMCLVMRRSAIARKDRHSSFVLGTIICSIASMVVYHWLTRLSNSMTNLSWNVQDWMRLQISSVRIWTRLPLSYP